MSRTTFAYESHVRNNETFYFAPVLAYGGVHRSRLFIFILMMPITLQLKYAHLMGPEGRNVNKVLI